MTKAYQKAKKTLASAVKTIDDVYHEHGWLVKANSAFSGKVVLLQTGQHFKCAARRWCEAFGYEIIEFQRAPEGRFNPLTCEIS